jgi:uncharacterized repeat protein (TIGR01451 family)
MKALRKCTAILGAVSVLFAHNLFAQSTTNLNITMTVDNAFEAYIATTADNSDGTLIGSHGVWSEPQTFGTALTNGTTNYLHIYAENFEGDGVNPAAFLGQFSLDNGRFEFPNGTQSQLTNTTNWQVSLDGYGGTYGAPASQGANGVGPWGTIAGIDGSAEWIWNPQTGDDPDTPVYFVIQIEPTTVDIAVSKTESIDPVVAGSGTGNLTYVVTATNNGPADATGVTVSEALTLPAGVTVESVTPSGTTSFTDPTWTIGDLASGASETLTVVLTADASTAAGVDVISNTATVTSVNETDENATSDSATESTSVVRQVDIAVSKTESIDPVVAGSGTGNLTYVVTATNNGPSNASGVALSETLTLPAGVTVDSVTPSGTTSFTDPTWTIGDLTPGASETLTVVLTVGPSAAVGTDVISDTASVTAVNETDTVAGNDSATESTSVAREIDIAVSKTESVETVVAGSGAGNLVYTITAENLGPSDVTGAEFTEDLVLPAGVTVDSVTGPGTIGGASPNYTWTAVDIAANASAELVVTLTVDPSAVVGTDVISDTAAFTGSTGGETETDNFEGPDSATEATSIAREVDIVVTKTESVETVVAGSGTGNLVYTITALNNGPSNVTGASFTEDLVLPTGVTVDSVVSSGAGVVGGASPNYTWSFAGDIAPAGSETLTVTLTVALTAEEGEDTISDTAAFSASTGGETIILNDDDSATEATSVRWPEATFNVSKAYEDEIGGEVTATLECTDTSGLLEYAPQAGTTPNALVVRRFDHSSDVDAPSTSCTVIESNIPAGFYETDRTEGCDVDPAADQGAYECTITNAVTVAYFEVTKEFSDLSPTEVEVTLTCNTGLPLEQSFMISDGNPVNFVVTWFEQGAMDCEITEVGEGDAYVPVYNNGTELSEISCAYESVEAGTGTYICAIGNEALPATFTVSKVWEFMGEMGDDIYQDVDVIITCDSEIFDDDGFVSAPYEDDGYWMLDVVMNDGDSVSVSVDTLAGPTECMAEEFLPEMSGIESSSDCDWRVIPANGTSACTITNTAFFEGIPTLSQYGMALMALLMLGVGFVGMRRFV